MAPRPPRRTRTRSISSALGATFVLALLLVAGITLTVPREARAASGAFHPLAGSTMVVLTATDALSFSPNQMTVPTLSVEVEIENVATTDHTFTLSSRVNQTAPVGTDASSNASGSWFDSAHVLADSVVAQGTTVFVNVTLPTSGSFQFICRYHYPAMVGVLSVGTPASTGSSSPSWYFYAGGGVVVLAIIVVAVLVMRRRPRAPTPAPAAPSP